MKFVLLVCSIVVFTFAVTAQSDESGALSAEVVKLYSAKKYAEAEAAAEKVVAMLAKSPGKTSLKYGQAVRNLALVRMAAGKNKQAMASFDDAIVVYRAQPSLDARLKLELAEMIELRAEQMIGGDRKNAEKLFAESLAIRENAGIANDGAISTTLLALAQLARIRRDDAAAESFAKRSFEMSYRSLPSNSYVVFAAESLYSCLATRDGRREAVKSAIAEIRQSPGVPLPAGDERLPKFVVGGVVNGKATSLAIPRYPEELRGSRSDGTVRVEVTIDELGKVISACAIEGPRPFYEVSEAAAYSSLFSPTKLSGTPVKVTGSIMYRFIP